MQYGLHEAELTAKRGGTRRFAHIDTALALLRTFRRPAVELHLAEAAPPPPAALVGRAPRGLRTYLLDLERQARDTSPTFARLHHSMKLPERY